MANLIIFSGQKVRNCAILDFHVFVECKKRTRWVHSVHSILQHRSESALRNSFRQNTTKQIKQNQLIYAGDTVLQKLLITQLNRKIFELIHTNIDKIVKSTNWYSSNLFLHLKQTRTLQKSPGKIFFPRMRGRMNQIKATTENRAHEPNQGNNRKYAQMRVVNASVEQTQCYNHYLCLIQVPEIQASKKQRRPFTIVWEAKKLKSI